MKEDQIEEDKKKWAKEINSDSNQNSINFYKKKLEEKEKKVIIKIKLNSNFLVDSRP